VIDDPHDPEEVESEAQRTHVHERWDGPIATRTNDIASSIRIGIAQRTHEDDWSAHRIADGWAHLDLPMLYEPERNCTTPLGFKDERTVEGECLHAERFPPNEIARLRTSMSERRWATLYQGRPAPAGGAMIKSDWLRYWRDAGKPDASNTRPLGTWRGAAMTLPDRFDSVCIAADLAGGKKTIKGDFNVIVAVAKRAADFFVLDVWRERADFPTVQTKYREFAKRWPGSRKAVEQAAAGGPLVASLQREISGLIGVPTGAAGKEERLEAVLQFFQAGNVHLCDHATYRDYAIHELTTFPNSRYDDLTDAIVLALGQLGALYVDAQREEKRHGIANTYKMLGYSVDTAERMADEIVNGDNSAPTEPAADEPQGIWGMTIEQARAHYGGGSRGGWAL
jgi:predicted phage terminase large subunit-like protein